jgi:hypothetical protein
VRRSPTKTHEPCEGAGKAWRQRFIEVTGPFTIETDDFRFADDYRGLKATPKAGTVIGHDGDRPAATPLRRPRPDHAPAPPEERRIRGPLRALR